MTVKGNYMGYKNLRTKIVLTCCLLLLLAILNWTIRLQAENMGMSLFHHILSTKAFKVKFSADFGVATQTSS